MSGDLPGWAQSLPEALQGAPHIKGTDSPEAWVQKIQTDAQWRGSSIRIPGEDATPEQRAESAQRLIDKWPEVMLKPTNDENAEYVYRALGKPDTAENYRLGEGKQYNGEEGKLKGLAHNLNWTNAQYEAYVDAVSAEEAANLEATQQQLSSDYDALRGEWGAAYDSRYAEVGKLLSTAPEHIQQAYKDGILPTSDLRWLYSLAQMGDESATVTGQETEAPTRITPDEALHQLREVEATMFAMEKDDPDLPRYIQKRVDLVKLAQGRAP